MTTMTNDDGDGAMLAMLIAAKMFTMRRTVMLIMMDGWMLTIDLDADDCGE